MYIVYYTLHALDALYSFLVNFASQKSKINSLLAQNFSGGTTYIFLRLCELLIATIANY